MILRSYSHHSIHYCIIKFVGLKYCIVIHGNQVNRVKHCQAKNRTSGLCFLTQTFVSSVVLRAFTLKGTLLPSDELIVAWWTSAEMLIFSDCVSVTATRVTFLKSCINAVCHQQPLIFACCWLALMCDCPRPGLTVFTSSRWLPLTFRSGSISILNVCCWRVFSVIVSIFLRSVRKLQSTVSASTEAQYIHLVYKYMWLSCLSTGGAI